MRQTSEMSKSCVTLKIKTTQGLPFEDIIGTRLGVEQIKQTVLYTHQLPEWSFQLSSAENRREWILQMFMYLRFLSPRKTILFFPYHRQDR